MWKYDGDSQRKIELAKLKVELNQLGAKLIEIETGVQVRCQPERRDEVIQLLADAGFVISS